MVAPDPVKDEDVPLQTVAGVAVAETTGMGFTVMLIALEVAGVPVAQVALEVNTQVTIFPVLRVVDVKVGPVAISTPFIFHW